MVGGRLQCVGILAWFERGRLPSHLGFEDWRRLRIERVFRHLRRAGPAEGRRAGDRGLVEEEAY